MTALVMSWVSEGRGEAEGEEVRVGTTRIMQIFSTCKL